MKATLLICLSILLVASCENLSQSQAKNNAKQPVQKPSAEAAPNDDFPAVLFGTLKFSDPANGGALSLSSDLETSDIGVTKGRGYEVKLPRSGSVTEMSVLNCSGWLGNATVRFEGLTEGPFAFSAQFIKEKGVDDLKQKMLDCMDRPVDPHFANAPVNFVFLVKTGKQPKSFGSLKPNWKEIVGSIPYEWRTASSLTANSSPKEIAKRIPNWADTDGDGKVDLLRITSRGDTERSIDFYRILHLVDGEWRQIWQTQQKETEN